MLCEENVYVDITTLLSRNCCYLSFNYIFNAQKIRRNNISVIQPCISRPLYSESAQTINLTTPVCGHLVITDSCLLISVC